MVVLGIWYDGYIYKLYGLAQNRRPIVPKSHKIIILIVLTWDDARFSVVPPSSHDVPN